MKLEGIHHVTCITADAPSNADFYIRVMGLRIVKKTINQTDMTTYHLFYGDEQASYGNNISFFEYRGRPDGRAGAGNVHRLVWRLASESAVDFWERRIADEQLTSERGDTWLRFSDPEGLEHELAVVSTTDPPLTGEAPDIPSEFALTGLDGFRAFATDQAASERFITEQLGFQPMAGDRFEARGAERGGWYAFDPAPAEKRRFGGGAVQHIAWGCRPEDIENWHQLVVDAGLTPTEVIDRHFFRSVYFTEPGGVLFEIAERGGPGFAVDEPDAEHMGDDLQLPPWLEERRKLYEYSLTPVPTTAEIRARATALASK
jgi:glyoxalase family protein